MATTSSGRASPSGMRTVLVLGASYAGHRAVQLLASSLPTGWRVVVIERNTHFNHLYAFPRVAVLPGHEHKTFIPYTNIFASNTYKNDSHPHLLIRASVTALSSHTVSFQSLETGEDGSLDFDYLIYALGSHLPGPINLWAENPSDSDCPIPPVTPGVEISAWPMSKSTRGTKQQGCRFMKKEQEEIKAARSVLVVGGGPLGVQYASDIAELYHDKEVTLIHSGPHLLPRFDEFLHYESTKKLEELGVKVILGSRVDLSSVNAGSVDKDRKLQTSNGQTVGAELVLLCTGQKPNTSFLHSFAPECINLFNGTAFVTRTLQLADPPVVDPGCPSPPVSSADEVFPPLPPSPSLSESSLPDTDSDSGEEPDDFEDEFSEEEDYLEEEEDLVPEPTHSRYPHIFVIGDAADAFGALKAGHTAWGQAEVAARNVLALIEEDGVAQLQHYYAPPYTIKVSLGLNFAVFQSREVTGTKGPGETGDEALNSHVMWTRRGLSTDDMTI